MDIQRIGVVGAGTMGSGIAEVAAVAGFAVQLCDSAPGQIEKSQKIIRSSLDKAARRGKLPQSEVDAILGRIDFGSNVASQSDCDFVVEAIVENADAKCQLVAELGRNTRPEIVLASNTSSISIPRLGDASGRTDRFIGMHFFNPVPIMPLVEVVRGRATNEATVVATEQLARRMGKTPVRANDAPGFVAKRVLMTMIN